GSGGSIALFDLLVTSNRAIGGAGRGTGRYAGAGLGGGLLLLHATVLADNIDVESNIAQGGAGLSGANAGGGLCGRLLSETKDSSTISDSLLTQNRALAGVATGGGINGFAEGGGIYHFGALDLINTDVFGNHATTDSDDLF